MGERSGNIEPAVFVQLCREFVDCVGESPRTGCLVANEPRDVQRLIALKDGTGVNTNNGVPMFPPDQQRRAGSHS